MELASLKDTRTAAPWQRFAGVMWRWSRGIDQDRARTSWLDEVIEEIVAVPLFPSENVLRFMAR